MGLGGEGSVEDGLKRSRIDMFFCCYQYNDLTYVVGRVLPVRTFIAYFKYAKSACLALCA